MIDLLVSSVITASLYAIVALGIVAIYKTTRIFNFAHPEITALSGYMGYQVTVVWERPFLVGLLVGVVVGAATAFVMEGLILRHLYQRSALEMVIATFGVALIIQTAIVRYWGHDPRGIPTPFGKSSFDVFGTKIPVYGGLVFLFAATSIVGLSILLGRTRLGLQLRAVFDDPVAARLVGVKVARIRTFTWVLGGALAGAAGVLLAPIFFLSPGNLLPVLIAGFAAAVIGGFSSFYGTIVGAFSVAAILNFGGSYISITFRNVILYVAMIVFLWLRPWGLFGEHEDWSEHFTRNEGEHAGSIRKAWNRALAALVSIGALIRRTILRGYPPQLLLHLAVVVLLFGLGPLLGPTWTLNLGTMLVYFLAVAGLSLALYYANQISLAQNAFVALGAYTTMLIMTEDAALWPLAIVVSLVGAAAVGALLAIPSVRAHGAYFVVITIAIGLIAPELAFKWTDVTGGYNGKPVPSPTFGGDIIGREGRYFLAAGVSAVFFLGLIAFRNSPLGRRMVAARDSEGGAASLGINPKLWSAVAFAIAAGAAAVAGSLSAIQFGFVTPSQFDFHLALMVVVATVIAGSITGAMWGAAIVVLVPIWLKGAEELAPAMLGLFLIVLLHALPGNRSGTDVLHRLVSPGRAREARPTPLAVSPEDTASAPSGVTPSEPAPPMVEAAATGDRSRGDK